NTTCENLSICSQSEHSYLLPGHGLNGMRLILAGMPLSSRINAFASSMESFTPLSITYSKVMRLALETPGELRHASRTSEIGYFRLRGTKHWHHSPRTAGSDPASMHPISAPVRWMLGTTPEVDNVMRRFEIPIPSPSATMSNASRTASKL